MEYLMVAAGGALGSLTRFMIGRKIAQKVRTGFPLATFIVNITGAVLLGMVSSLGVNANIYVLWGDGFLGAYTTFSTFMYEGFNLFCDNRKLNAAVYIISSLILGIIGYLIGFKIFALLS